MPDLFISWSGEHARKIGEEIKSLFPDDGKYNVFLSSWDINRGRWRDTILSSLRGAIDGIVIFSQEAAKSDWLLHESAVLSAKIESGRKKGRLHIFMLGAPKALLPSPLNDLQVQVLTGASLKNALRDLCAARKVEISLQELVRLEAAVQKQVSAYEESHVSGHDNKWERAVGWPLSISRQSDSPFELAEILRIARKRVVLVAQNHRYMTNAMAGKRHIGELIFQRLSNGVHIDIVAMHHDALPPGVNRSDDPAAPQVHDGCIVWGHMAGAQFQFEDHVAACWETLLQWEQKYQSLTSRPRGELRIRGAYLLPSSINIVDPDEENGFLVLSPRFPQERDNLPRPQFIVTRKEERPVFEFYWGAVSSSFDNAGWKHVRELYPHLS